METIIHSPNISREGVRSFFTSRRFSETHNSLKEALSTELGLDKDNVYLPIQKHTSHIHVLDTDLKPVEADAVLTARSDVLIGVIVADCVPVLIYDQTRHIIGAVHAGWKGTAGGIMRETLLKMNAVFNSQPDDLLVSVGPSIKKCSYEVNEDVKAAVTDMTGHGHYYMARGDKKYMLDLAEANKIQATSAGVPEKNIWISDECTYCNPEKYYSYRYENQSRGRQGAFIGMW